ncbi:MAG TPA: sodium:alanine symporter family protein [Candidatus Krumholzibacteria bacterium]|nr:sodium:alanine symporter family protein [Candidatus Krumholzibacteria bacterium]
MHVFESLVSSLNSFIWGFGIQVGDQTIPGVVIALLGTGVFLTLRLGFIQVRRLGHGFGVTSGKYDDPNEPGDVPHFQALTTALSATVGIGNIAGVAIAIHWGGPGALFWMWVTASLGMAVKYTEVTLAQKYREVEKPAGAEHAQLLGTVSGGPMYYIEKGLGSGWRWMALFFAGMLGFTAFLTGNAVQANTVADTMQTTFGVAPWITGLLTSAVVAGVVLGGIRRIGKVTGYLAPAMAGIYVLGALYIILTNLGELMPSLALIVKEAFNPTAGVAGTGVGAILMTMMWGVKRGLFSNEAGQGSAPIAHAAAKTDEPVSEGVVALLEPFIDTLVICTMTGLVIIMTGVWNDVHPTAMTVTGGDSGWVTTDAGGHRHDAAAPERFAIRAGRPADDASGAARYAWHEVAVEEFFTDPEMGNRFSGEIIPADGVAVDASGNRFTVLYGMAVENGAPLTMNAFSRGLPGQWGKYIVVISVLLFAVSTAISWSYYGDRCANYLWGAKSIFPYKLVFVAMHFFGAVVSLNVVWELGDIALGVVILPNLIALVLLSGKVREMTDSYFTRKPWVENAAVHRSLKKP